jgi:hypothetical protein
VFSCDRLAWGERSVGKEEEENELILKEAGEKGFKMASRFPNQ